MRSITVLSQIMLTGILSLVVPRTCAATWSIVLADSTTKEVAVGSVTCLTNFDLRAETPVVLIGIGGATSQALIDADGSRRIRIFNRLLQRVHPEEIIEDLATLGKHPLRQYGIVDTLGRSATFTGGATSRWAGGVVGQIGTISYAIQGNILAGPCVVAAIETAVRTAPGDIPEKLMQGMIAARVTGGDGRCSCMSGPPTSCGCPPVTFNKSGHIGYLITARTGDSDDPVCNDNGCADGDYFMNLNFPFQFLFDPDPVFQMGQAFRVWRADLIGRPDAIQSVATIASPDKSASGNQGFEMTIQLNDWQEIPVATGTVTVTVEHEDDSDGFNAIGAVMEQGDGVFTVELTPQGVGTDRYRITADDGGRPVILMPSPTLCFGDVAGGFSPDCNGNGEPDECEIFEELIEDVNENGVPDPCEKFLRGDCDADSATLIGDAIRALGHMFDGVTTVFCQKACDTNDDGTLNLEDPLMLLRFFILSGPPPAPPFGECGFDTTPDDLACDPFPPCL